MKVRLLILFLAGFLAGSPLILQALDAARAASDARRQVAQARAVTQETIRKIIRD